jgi:hypothetical protein
MSATFGDGAVREIPEKRTGAADGGREIRDRPVPLDFDLPRGAALRGGADLVEKGRAPIYVVNFTQRSCAERRRT